MKRERTKGKVVAICGPRDSGKTTLVSQLLQKPDLALGTGLTGGVDETQLVTPYSLSGLKGFVILDSPGLTGPEQTIRNKFDYAALNLSSTFVYIREYNGLPTEVDVETTKRILLSASRTKAPNILVCLNRCVRKLTQAAHGEIFHLKASKEKKAWLRRLDMLQSESKDCQSWMKELWSKCSITVEFVELTGDKELEATLSADDRTGGIQTASSIGEWVAEKVAPPDGETNEDWDRLSAHMRNFDHGKWQTGVRESLHAREREEAEETERLTEAFANSH